LSIDIIILICVYSYPSPARHRSRSGEAGGVVSLTLFPLPSFLEYPMFLSFEHFYFCHCFVFLVSYFEFLPQKAGCSIKHYRVFGVCSPDFSTGGPGGAFLPHAEIKGASKTATKHIKTRPFLKTFFIPQSIFLLLIG